MKVRMLAAPKVTIEAEGSTHAEVFEQAAGLQEVFSCVGKCAKCNGTDIRLVVRQNQKGNTFYEAHCQNRSCRARLSFGQNDGVKKGCLYPRRKETEKKTVMGGDLEAGAWLPNDGWIKWNPKTEKNE